MSENSKFCRASINCESAARSIVRMPFIVCDSINGSEVRRLCRLSRNERHFLIQCATMPVFQVPRIWERETTDPKPTEQTTISPGKRVCV